ncbi:hypothetical protein RBJ15_11310 [Pantoea sp. BS_4]|uniref:hypothetical protein n=1 Tax=unclassified Pantoea TaxID=2630326 RepID=UPI0035BF0676
MQTKLGLTDESSADWLPKCDDSNAAWQPEPAKAGFYTHHTPVMKDMRHPSPILHPLTT